MTSKQLLLLLDDSADVHEGSTFFPRDEDGLLKTQVPGWEQQIDTQWVFRLLRPLLEWNKKTGLLHYIIHINKYILINLANDDS